MAEVVALGEILVEMIATEVGQTFRAPGLFAGPSPSGALAIFADQAARCGAATALSGRVGENAFGTLSIERRRADGVDASAIRRVPHATTGIASVTYRPGGGRDFIFTIAQSAAATLDAAQLAPGMFSGCRWFHVMGSSLFSAPIAAVS